MRSSLATHIYEIRKRLRWILYIFSICTITFFLSYLYYDKHLLFQVVLTIFLLDSTDIGLTLVRAIVLNNWVKWKIHSRNHLIKLEVIRYACISLCLSFIKDFSMIQLRDKVLILIDKCVYNWLPLIFFIFGFYLV